MKTTAIITFLLFLQSALFASVDMPILREKDLNQDQIMEIYLKIKDMTDGLQICDTLDRYGWFTELDVEMISSVRHPYISYKANTARLKKSFSGMTERDFSIQLDFQQTTIITAYRHGLLEKERVISLVKNGTNHALQRRSAKK